MLQDSLNLRRFIAAVSLLLMMGIAACTSGNDSGEPTPTSTPSASERAPTALAPIPPTPTANSTLTSTRTPTTTPPSGLGDTPTPFQPTATGIPGPSTPSPATDPDTPVVPTPTPVTIETGRELVNQSQGVMQLQPEVGQAIEYSPGASAANFRIHVEFSNPFHPDFAAWNYGIKFRNDDETYQMFIVDHTGKLNYIKGNGPELTVVWSEPYAEIFTPGGLRNEITLLAIEGRAFVLLNKTLVGEFDIEDSGVDGEISIVTDIYNETFVVGAHTQFFDLVINSAGVIGHSAAGRLTRSEPSEPAVGEFSLPTSAGYARVTLVSPVNAFSGDFSYGFVFRTEGTGIDNWLVFDDSKNWRHIRRSTTGTAVTLAQGTAPSFRTGQGDENTIEFLSTDGENKIYLNGALITNFSVLDEDKPFTVAPMAGYEPNHQPGGMATEFRDFAVWSVEQ